MTTFSAYSSAIDQAGGELHASELHGLLIGYLCAVKSTASRAARHAMYAEWLSDELSDSLTQMLDGSYDDALENLDEFSDFDFSPLLPDDEQPISNRVESLAAWCGGFLSGLGQSGRAAEFSEDVQEALRDLAKIAAVADEVPEGDDNESDFIELVEFARITTLMIFAESKSQGTH